MLRSHESPIAYLEQSRKYNDYDYCLVHLCEDHPEYLKFFIDSIKQGREVLLDNSIFELGVSFDPKKFAGYIEKIKPTYYVVPDVLEDSEGTIRNWKQFNTLLRPSAALGSLAIGVVQGKTYEELVKCYEFMSEKADYIAISFDYSYYQTTGIGDNKLEKMANGRHELIRRFIRDGIWNHDKPHHLLGCALATEFAKYKDIPNIRSVDTSNPVVAALDGVRYIKGIGLHKVKPPVKLADRIKEEYDYDTLCLIQYNVKEFDAICNS